MNRRGTQSHGRTPRRRPTRRGHARGRSTPPHAPSRARSPQIPRGGPCARGRGTLDGHADHVLPPQNYQTQRPLLGPLLEDGGALLVQRAEFFGVHQDEVEVLVERQEGADDGASVGEGDAEAMLDVSKELGSLPGRHCQ